MALNIDRASLGTVDPELEKLLAAMPALPATLPDVQTLRAMAAQRHKAAANSSKDNSGLEVEESHISTRDGTKIPIRTYRPSVAPEGGSPLFVFYHGGGYCIGGLENGDLSCRNFAQELGMVAVNVDYRLAPEHPWPTGVNDAYDALKWAASHASELKANPARGFIVGGTSAGGNFAAVVSHLARDEKLSPPLTGVLLAVPSTVDGSVVPEKYRAEFQSQEALKDAPILDARMIELFLSNYQPRSDSELFSPMIWPSGHATLPPTFFQICGLDPLRDEGFIYQKMLEDAGVVTKCEVYPGLPHGFWSFFPQLSASETFKKNTLEGTRWLLEQVKA